MVRTSFVNILGVVEIWKEGLKFGIARPCNPQELSVDMCYWYMLVLRSKAGL